jgi:hypothetical protein
MRQIILVLGVLGACGGSDDNAVSGTVHGMGISVVDSVSAAITVNTNQHGAAILLTSTGNLCTDLTGNVRHPNEKGVIITVEDVMGLTLTTPTAPGMYSIYQGGQAPPKAATLQTIYSDANCARVANSEGKGTSGSVTLSAVSGNAFDGTFDVVLDSGDHIKGNFHPTECPQLQMVIDGTGTPSCQ